MESPASASTTLRSPSASATMIVVGTKEGGKPPFKLDSEASKSGYAELLKLSKSIGVSSTYMPLPTPLPTAQDKYKDVYSRPDFELHYKKPMGFCIITRDAFPASNKPERWSDCALLNCIGQKKPEVISNYIAFANDLKKSCAASINSKLFTHLTACAKESGMTQVDSKAQVCTLKHVWDKWCNDIPSKDTCEKVWKIFYGSFEEDNSAVMRRMEFEILMEHHLWFSDADNLVNRISVGGRVKNSCIWHMIRDKTRDTFRNKYNLDKKVMHGIRVGVTRVSEPGQERKRSSRKKSQFIFEDCVTGWMSSDHMMFLERKSGCTAEDGGIKQPEKKATKTAAAKATLNETSSMISSKQSHRAEVMSLLYFSVLPFEVMNYRLTFRLLTTACRYV
jgi:hypothetical protein